MSSITRKGLVVAFMSTLLSLFSCTIEFSGNGDFDGFWHLTSVDTLLTGGRCDLSGNLRYWGVNFNLIRLQDFGENEAQSFYVRFDLEKTTLRLYEMRDASSGQSAGETVDTLVADPSVLSPYGINSLNETFTIEKLTGGSMILSTSELRLRFTKM